MMRLTFINWHTILFIINSFNTFFNLVFTLFVLTSITACYILLRFIELYASVVIGMTKFFEFVSSAIRLQIIVKYIGLFLHSYLMPNFNLIFFRFFRRLSFVLCLYAE